MPHNALWMIVTRFIIRLTGSEHCEQVIFGDFWGLDTPNSIQWPAGEATDFLLTVYDWDAVVIDPPRPDGSGGAELSAPIELCTGFYPCALWISGSSGQNGDAQGVLLQNGPGAIICAETSGCTSLQLLQLQLVCNGNDGDSALQVLNTHISAYYTFCVWLQ